MITEEEYLNARSIVIAYESQQIVINERLKQGDFELAKLPLTTRSKNALVYIYPFVSDPIRLIYLSDIVKLINKTGIVGVLLRFPNLSYKSYVEIMSYVLPFLSDKQILCYNLITSTKKAKNALK